MPRPTGVLIVLVVLACVACGGASGSSQKAPATADTTPVDGNPGKADTNQIRLSAAESSRLVSWADTFRSCMVAKGNSLGRLETAETQIRMGLSTSVDVDGLLADLENCGERQGGPPHRSSLQYRPGEIVLYLPKRCLLDKKVIAS